MGLPIPLVLVLPHPPVGPAKKPPLKNTSSGSLRDPPSPQGEGKGAEEDFALIRCNNCVQATPQSPAVTAPLTQGSQCIGAAVIGRDRLPCVRGGGSDTSFPSRWGCLIQSRSQSANITCLLLPFTYSAPTKAITHGTGKPVPYIGYRGNFCTDIVQNLRTGNPSVSFADSSPYTG